MQGGLGSAGALSHAYVQHPPLRCDIPDIRGLFYDDANKFLIAPTADRILYWKIALCTPSGPPNSDPVNEGPVLSVRFSLDQKAIGIQRSNREVEFRNRETGEACSNKCRADSETMLGFFWTDCPTCDVIIIKTSGLDLLVYERQSNALRLVESKKFNMSWYLYTHESRLLLLASGMQSTLFTGYQFSAGGIVKLPKFEMIMSTCEANNKPVLAATDVHIVTVYGRIYCLQLDRVNMGLNLYRFYRDAVVQQGTLPIYSSRVAVSAVDNIIMVHQIDAKVVILYDVFMDSFTPISAPLPLLVRGLPSNNRQPGQLADHQSAYGGTIYGEGWNFLIPDLICDSENGLLWKLHLDLEAVAASTSDAPSVLELLQRRKSDLSMVKTLSLAIVRTIILERRPITMVAKAMAVVLDSYSCLMKMGGSVSGVRRASEQQQSSGQPFEDSSVILLEPPSRTMIRPVVNTESASGVETRPPQSNSGVEHGIASLAAHVDRTSLNTSSNSDDIINTSRGSQTSDATSERPQALGEDRRPLASGTSIQHGPHGAGVAISPIEMFQSVFVLVEDEMMGDPAYLIAVIMEFLRSMSKAGLKAPPKLYVMMTALLAHSNRYAEIALFVSNKILEPSRELAMQLIELGRHHLLTRKLGVDMLRERCLHDDYVAALLHEGYYLEALRYARKYKVITVQPALFLEKAVAMDSVQNLAAVLSFFSEFTPSFKTTLDYSRYRHILSEMI